MADLPEKLEFKSTFLNKEDDASTPEQIMKENPSVPISDVAILLSKAISSELAKISGCSTRVEQSIILVKQVSERKFISDLTKYTFMSFIYTDLRNLGFWALQPFDYVLNGSDNKIEQKAYRMLIFDPVRHEKAGDEKYKKDLPFLHQFFEKYIRGKTVKEGQQVQFGLLLKAIKEGLESPGKQLYFDLEIPDKDARWIFQLHGNELYVYFSKTAAPNTVLEPAQMSPWISSIHPYFVQMHSSHFYVELTPENIEAIKHENLDEYVVNDGLFEVRPGSPTSVAEIDEVEN